jgi:AcrR family transcriptional regulator
MAYRKSAETRDRILEAAGALFERGGYYNVAIGAIAEEAGIGRASLYYYFLDKEAIARALFDSIADRIVAQAEAAVGEGGDLLLLVMIEYILLFRDIALNSRTRAVYYDLANYADYDAKNIERLKRTSFRHATKLAELYGRRLDDERLSAMIVTSDAYAKALFKGIQGGTLKLGLKEATDLFFRRMILPDIPVAEAEYRRKLRRAFAIAASLRTSGRA